MSWNWFRLEDSANCSDLVDVVLTEGMVTKKESGGRPHRLAAVSGVLKVREAPPFEEAPVARAGPRSPDAFYRGEEAGAAIKILQ